MSRAKSKRAGENVESEVIQLVPGLSPIPERDAHADAVADTAIEPTHELPTVALPVVEKGTEIEIKSCSVVVTNDQDPGRFYLRRKQHEHLKDVSGSYLFALTPPHDARPTAMKIVPATIVCEYIPSWINPEDRATYGQIQWTHIFESDEVRGFQHE